MDKRRWGISHRHLVAAWLLAACVFSWGTAAVRGEEPYRQFLAKLRQEQMFELALVYLDELEAAPGVNAKFKQDVALERGMLLYQAAAVLPARSPNRVEKLDAAEATLRQFLEQRKDHPRRGEARLKLGELLLTRAEEARSQANSSEEEIPEAIKFYDDAHKLFENTISELAAILDQIKGARIDPNNSEMVAYRQQVQQDVRQAQLLSAKSVEERGKSRGAKQPESKRDLEQAEQMYTDLYAKEQRMVGIRNYALFYRSGVQADLGKVDDAIDGYQRVADLEGAGQEVLRALQTDSTAKLLPLLGSQGKFELAVDRATNWLKGLRPDERTSAAGLSLQLELVRLRIAWVEALRKQDPKDRLAERLIRDVRPELRSLLRTPGPHLNEARDLLAELGVETAESKGEELPTVKSFGEGLAEAQKRLDEAEADALGMELLRATIEDPSKDDETRAAARAELETLRETVTRKREAALQLLRDGVRLFGSEDDRNQLFEARFRMAFLLLKLDSPWESMVIADFLAHTNPKTESGLRASAITLASFSELLSAAGEDKSEVVVLLAPFAEYLIATWPQSNEAAASASALAQLSIVAKQWDKAENYLGMVPAENQAIGKQRRDLGISFYIEYLKETQQNSGEETEQGSAFRQRAIKWLELGLSSIAPADYDPTIVDSINALARLQLQAGRAADAAKWLLAEPNGLVAVLESRPEWLQPKAAMETLRTAIQVVTSQLVEGDIDQDQAVPKLRQYIEQLQTTAQATEGGGELLTGISVALARDLKDKLAATKDTARRTRLSEALLLVIDEAAKSDAFNTRYWAGSTAISLAEDLIKQQGGRESAMDAFEGGSAILQAILAEEERQPGWIQPEGAKLQIRVTLAKAQRGLGKYQEAVLSLGEILDDNQALLDVQIEAAETLQAWGKTSPQFYRAAMMGGRKKGGQNVIWGWGKIAQMTTNQPNFTEQFYNARYQLALSRFRYANSLNDAEEKQTQTRLAEKDILSTAALYPELGGSAKKREYNELLKEIQQALGKPATGLGKD